MFLIKQFSSAFVQFLWEFLLLDNFDVGDSATGLFDVGDSAPGLMNRQADNQHVNHWALMECVYLLYITLA